MNRLITFGRGLGAGLFLGVPALTTFVAFLRQEVFSFVYMREVGILSIWLAAIALIARLKSIKVGKAGVELFFDTQPIHPDQAIPKQPERKAD